MNEKRSFHHDDFLYNVIILRIGLRDKGLYDDGEVNDPAGSGAIITSQGPEGPSGE